MHDINIILSDIETTKIKLLRRGFVLDGEKLQSFELMRKDLLKKYESLKSENNQLSKKVEELKRHKSENTHQDEIASLKNKSSVIKASISEIAKELESTTQQLNEYMLSIPNLPSDKCPDGLDEETKVEISRWGSKPVISNISDHVEIGENLKILDIPRAAKISGARFNILVGAGARLERALVNFLLDTHSSNGYLEISVPFLVNRKSMTGTGQLPKFEDELFKIKRPEQEDLFLIPTAEVPVTNFYSDEKLNHSKLPIKFVCYSGCFRAEAGSYGRDTKGIIRQHQFHKIELVKICDAEKGWHELEELKAQAEKVLQLLNLHYRVVNLPAGDIAFGAEFCYDLEVWIPSQNKFREISSCSLYGTFQARRCNIRVKKTGKDKTELPATVNGSALPLGRTIVAILEQNLQPDGSVLIPDVLRKYTGFSKILPGGKTE